MKNFYQILEINENASQEIIDKAYKVLVKKYHPDLQTTAEEKNKCEEKIKQINEAYETISNPDLRAKYDNMLQEEYNKKLQMQQEEKLKKQYQQQQNNINMQNQTNQVKAKQPNFSQNNQNNYSQNQQNIREEEYQRQYQNAINKAYHDAYIQDLKNRGYKIKYKKTFYDYIRSLISILITIGIIFLIVQIPVVKEYLFNLYNNNELIHGIVDTFSNIFK